MSAEKAMENTDILPELPPLELISFLYGERCNNIKFVALLHDIGKIGIPDSVLNKPGKQ